MWRQLIQWTIEVLYPARCPVCEDILVGEDKKYKICTECKKKLVVIQEPYCKKCGKPLTNEEKEYCFDCSRKEFLYQYGNALWVYNTAMQQSMAAFKYRHKKEYMEFYITELWKWYGEQLLQKCYDVIVPVPIHIKKRKHRGYNQAELLGRKLSEYLHVPLEDDLLIRRKNTQPQKGLNEKQRSRNLKEAFSVKKEKIPFYQNKKVLLIDDIYTTGSTINCCTKKLLSVGIKEVYFICLCIGQGY